MVMITNTIRLKLDRGVTTRGMIHPSMHPMIHGDVVYLLHSPLSNAFGAWVCIAGDQWVGTVMFFYHGDDGIAALRWAKDCGSVEFVTSAVLASAGLSCFTVRSISLVARIILLTGCINPNFNNLSFQWSRDLLHPPTEHFHTIRYLFWAENIGLFSIFFE